ncbi:MAG TPA: threonine/serine dehydratase [Stellaceae bacterium]|nr:threonine/serine dehydratase [Stellaceae bacterium]
MLSLDDVHAAAARIEGKVRRTPLIEAAPTKRALGAGKVSYKLECLQVTGSFKARGAISKLGTLTDGEIAKGLVTASGGNHGLAIAYAGWLTGRPATIFVPENVSPAKAAKIKEWGAELVVTGKVWDESNRAAMAHVERSGATYVHPFADTAIMAGQGTIALELFADDPAIDTLIVAIGGGGLIAGIATAAKALNPRIRIVGVEPYGAPTLHASLAAGRVVELKEITTIVPTMAARKTEAINFDIIRRHVEEVVLVSDDEMREAAKFLWFESGLAVDLSGAAAVAALLTGRVRAEAGSRTCALVCGAGADGIV